MRRADFSTLTNKFKVSFDLDDLSHQEQVDVFQNILAKMTGAQQLALPTEKELNTIMEDYLA
jgi:hypothetical protein